MNRPKFDFRKIILIISAVVVFLLVMDLNTRLSELFRLTHERNLAQTQVSRLEQTMAALNAQLEYAKSDKAVEEWAYQEGHMVREGEKLIIPVAPPGATPMPILEPTPTPRVVQNWEIWWALFFGE